MHQTLLQEVHPTLAPLTLRVGNIGVFQRSLFFCLPAVVMHIATPPTPMFHRRNALKHLLMAYATGASNGGADNCILELEFRNTAL